MSEDTGKTVVAELAGDYLRLLPLPTPGELYLAMDGRSVNAVGYYMLRVPEASPRDAMAAIFIERAILMRKLGMVPRTLDISTQYGYIVELQSKTKPVESRFVNVNGHVNGGEPCNFSYSQAIELCLYLINSPKSRSVQPHARAVRP
ncbi:MAG: hypothetical protein E6R03_14795 [Hyphomicrobiaceae bacterium]|nr:MAG: hypothetical protein E6R03_14795 [Hyphomicrobiaceae bacterium]